MKYAKLASIILSPIFFAAAVFAAADTTVQTVKNQVVVVVNGAEVALKAGDAIPAGATVKVAKGAAAQVRLPDGSVVGVAEGAVFTVSTTSSGAVIVNLTSGEISVRSNASKNSALTIITPAGTVATTTKGTATAKATASTVSVTAVSGNWRVTTTTGDNAAIARNQTILLKKGDATLAVRPASKSEIATASETLNAGESAPASSPVADPVDADVSIDGVDIYTAPVDSPSNS